MRRGWLVATAGMLMMAAPLLAQNEEDVRSRLDTTVALGANGTVQLALVSGDIIVTSWARNEVKIHATSDRGVLQFDASPSRVQLRVRSDQEDMGDTRYEVTIPAGARLTANSVSGDVRAQGGSDVDLHSVSGDMTAGNISGKADIESVSGGVTVTKVGGGASVSTVSGDVHLTDITGDLSTHTVSGEIQLDGVKSSYVTTQTVSGDTRFRGSLAAQGRYEFRSHSGDVELIVPPTGATVNAETFSGDVQSAYPMTLSPGGKQGARNMRFTINGGGAQVSVTTFSGDVTITRASGANREN